MNKKALVLAGFVVFALAAAARQGAVLRRDLKEDSTEVYKLKTDIAIKANSSAFGDGDLSVNMTTTMTLKSGKLDGASNQLGVDATISDIQSRVDGSIAQYVSPMFDNLPKEIKFNGKLDGRNRITVTDAKTPDSMLTMLTGTSPSSAIAFVEFPEKAVNVGDSWTIPAPKVPIIAKGQTLTAKLVGEKDLDGSKVWQIAISGKLTIDANSAEITKGAPAGGDPPPNMTLKGTADFVGEALVDKTSGKTLQYTSTTTQKTKMDLPDMSMTVDNSGTIKTTMTLTK